MASEAYMVQAPSRQVGLHPSTIVNAREPSSLGGPSNSAAKNIPKPVKRLDLLQKFPVNENKLRENDHYSRQSR